MGKLERPPQYKSYPSNYKTKFTVIGPRNEAAPRWQFYTFLGLFLGTGLLFMWPIIISPIRNPDKYKQINEETQRQLREAGYDPSKAPGGLRKWRDPFRKYKHKEEDED